MIDRRTIGRSPRSQERFFNLDLTEQLRRINPKLGAQFIELNTIDLEIQRVGKLVVTKTVTDQSGHNIFPFVSAHLALAATAAYPETAKRLALLIKSVEKLKPTKKIPTQHIDTVRQKLQQQLTHLESNIPGGWLDNSGSELQKFQAISRNGTISPKEYSEMIDFFSKHVEQSLETDDHSSYVSFTRLFFSAWLLFCLPEDLASEPDFSVIVTWSNKILPSFELLFSYLIQDLFDEDSSTHQHTLRLVDLLSSHQRSNMFYAAFIHLLTEEMIEPRFIDADLPSMAFFLEQQYQETDQIIYRTLAQAIRSQGGTELDGFTVKPNLCVFDATTLEKLFAPMSDLATQVSNETANQEIPAVLTLAMQAFGRKKFELTVSSESHPELRNLFGDSDFTLKTTFDAASNYVECSLQLFSIVSIEDKPYRDVTTVFNFGYDSESKKLITVIDDPDSISDQTKLTLRNLVQRALEKLINDVAQKIASRKESALDYPTTPQQKGKRTQRQLGRGSSQKGKNPRQPTSQPLISLPTAKAEIDLLHIPKRLHLSGDLSIRLERFKTKGSGKDREQLAALDSFLAKVNKMEYTPTSRNATILRAKLENLTIWRFRHGSYRFLAVTVEPGQALIFSVDHRSEVYNFDFNQAAQNAYDEYHQQ